MRIIGNTLAVSVYSLLAEFPCCILLALMMNELRSGRFKKVMQFVTYAPHFISTIVLVGIMQQLFAAPSALMRTGGVVNTLIQALGGSPVPFMTSETAFRHMYVWTGVWQNAGWGSIIYMATLSGVDPQQYEAAMLDGANKLQRVWHITLPGISNIIVIMFILAVGGILDAGFEQVLLVGHIGKFVKLAGGIMNTHSRWADCRMELISAHAALHGADRKTIEALMQAATTDACLDLLESCGLRQKVVETLADKAQWHVSRRVGGAYQAGLVFYSQQQGELFVTEQARQIIEHFS